MTENRLVVAWEGEREITKRDKETFGGEYVYYLDCVDDV